MAIFSQDLQFYNVYFNRWLISQGRIKEATKIIRSFAKVNGKDVDEALFVEFEVLNLTKS